MKNGIETRPGYKSKGWGKQKKYKTTLHLPLRVEEKEMWPKGRFGGR
jgi:hypothetical protein